MVFGPDVWARIQLWGKQSLWALASFLRFIYECVCMCSFLCARVWVGARGSQRSMSGLHFLSQGLSVSIWDPPDSTSLCRDGKHTPETRPEVGPFAYFRSTSLTEPSLQHLRTPFFLRTEDWVQGPYMLGKHPLLLMDIEDDGFRGPWRSLRGTCTP